MMGFTLLDNQIISEAMGCEIYLPHDEPPQYRRRALGDSKDLTKLKRVDPYSSGRMPVILSATRLARKSWEMSTSSRPTATPHPFHCRSPPR